MERVRTISLCIFLAIFWGGILSPCSLAFSQELDDQNRSGKLEGAIIISPPSPKYIQLFQEIGPQKQPYIDFEVSGLQQKVRSNPLNVKLHYELGFEYAERGFFEESSKELEKALALDPNFVKAMVVLGTVYFNTKKYKNGERILLAALKLDENNALALNNLACLYYYSPLINKDRFSKALPLMLQSVELSPDDSIIRWNLAQMLEQECFGGNDEACIDSRNAWKKVIELIRLSEDEHHEKIAIEHLKKLKRLFIENPRQ